MMRSDSGSAFIEALVATAIVASVMAAMFGAIDQAGVRRHQIESRRTALLIARSELAAVGDEIPVTPGQIDGAQGDFLWRVRIEPGQPSGPAGSLAGAPALVRVSVRAAAGGDDLVVLKTLRLAPAP
jgi:hypothetical protein